MVYAGKTVVWRNYTGHGQETEDAPSTTTITRLRHPHVHAMSRPQLRQRFQRSAPLVPPTKQPFPILLSDPAHIYMRICLDVQTPK